MLEDYITLGRFLQHNNINKLLLFSLCIESVDFKESTDGTAPGFPVAKRPSRSKSGAKPTIVSSLEDIEVNDGENVTLEV